MNNKICNPKQEVPSSKELNDKDYLTAILNLEKMMIKNYAVSLTEASNSSLYNDYYDMFNEISNIQREVYNLMFKKGWYELEEAKDNKIGEKLNTFEQEFKELES